MKNKSGFTLVEIMIAVGIILILAVIAIPNLLRGKINANEAAAVTALKTISNASNLYTIEYNNFPPDGANGFRFLSRGLPPYLNFDYSTAMTTPKDGYLYRYSYLPSATNPDFNVYATVYRWGVTGTRNFFVDSTGVVRYCAVSGCTPNGNSPGV